MQGNKKNPQNISQFYSLYLQRYGKTSGRVRRGTSKN